MYFRRLQIDDDDDIAQKTLANNHHAFQWPTHLGRTVYYAGEDGIEKQTFGNSTIGIGHQHHYNKNSMHNPFSGVLVNDNGPQEPHYYNMYHQVTNRRLLLPAPAINTPALSSIIPPVIVSSLVESHSYYMHHTPATTAFNPPPQIVPQAQSIGNTVKLCQKPRINSNENNTTTAGGMVKYDSSSCFRQLYLEKNTFTPNMSPTVIVNNTLTKQRQRPSNYDEAFAEAMITKQTNGYQNTMEVNDEKVVSVCKRTILSAINKIIIENHVSALYKLRKTIRILDVLMFNEEGPGIGSAKIETVRPWMEMLKDVERCISLKHEHHHNL